MRNYLNALHQDILLQFYRLFFLISQGVFFIVGFITLFQANFLYDRVPHSLIFLFHLILSFFSIFIALFLARKINMRKKDVDFWHKEILKIEKKGSYSSFFEFKKWQYFNREKNQIKKEVPINLLINRNNKKIELTTLMVISILMIWVIFVIISFNLFIMS
jgi:hypothetical protein